MKTAFINHKYFFILILIFIAAECIVNPLGEFPLNDDWSYSKSVLNWHKDGKYSIGDWPAMTLFTHLFWGLLFTKTFGFSFFILRASILVASIFGISVLFFLIKKITNQPLTAFVACLVLLFNPLYFNLSNTYMTDVSFNTLMLLCFYFAHNFFTKQKINSFILFFVFSLLLVFTRQFGLVAPVSFTIVCFFLKTDRKRFFIWALISTVIIFLALKQYEDFLKQILNSNSAYKFSSGINPILRVFWDNFFDTFKARYATIGLHILVYTFPFSLAFAPQLLKNSKLKTIVICAVISLLITFPIFNSENFPIGNIFYNIGVGTETFFEALSQFKSRLTPHTFSQPFKDATQWVKLFCIASNLLLIFLFVLKLNSLKKSVIKLNSFALYLLLFMFLYITFLLITESYYDRYHIPLITASIIAFAHLIKLEQIRTWIIIAPIVALFYISVFGTKDYFTINTKRWEAYHYLTKNKHIHKDKINGGFEINCWNEGEYSYWYLFLELKWYDYLIQYRDEPGFKLYKELEFQRYLPYKKDKVNIFVRDSTSINNP